MTTPWLGCVADDFTGGTDVAAALRRSGLRTRLLFGAPAVAGPLPECDAVVVALKTRSAPVEQAVAQSREVVRWLDQLGVDRFYVKYCSTFDSTPTGNIGPIVDAVLAELGETATVLCPASPEHGRTVFHGHLFVHDRLLSESSMATHPLTPMTDADLRRVLAPQTPYAVGLLDHAALAAGVDTAAQQLEDLRDNGIRHVIADAVDELDLITLASAAQQWRVLTGGAGLARAVAELRPARGPAVSCPLPVGPSVVIAGSCSAATLGQVEHARHHMAAHHITPATSDDPDEIWSRARRWLDEHTGPEPVLVYATAPADERARTQDVFGDKTAAIIEDLLARAAHYAVSRGVRRVVVAGGETSGAVVQALEVRSVVVAQEADTGIPWCLTTARTGVAAQVRQLRSAGPAEQGGDDTVSIKTALRHQIVALGASFFERRLTFGRTGNISVRIDDHALLTPTGASLGALEPESLSVVDATTGEHLDGPKPSKEAFLHAAVYRARPDAGAVVHLHSTHSVAVSCLADVDPADVLPPLTAYYVMRVGKLPLLPYHAPGDPELGQLAHDTARDHHAMLLANHGPVVAGPDLATAADAVEELEETAALHLLLRGHATRPLTVEKVAQLHDRFNLTLDRRP